MRQHPRWNFEDNHWGRQANSTNRGRNGAQETFSQNGVDFVSGVLWSELYLFENRQISQAKLIALSWCMSYFSHSRSRPETAF